MKQYLYTNMNMDACICGVQCDESCGMKVANRLNVKPSM